MHLFPPCFAFSFHRCFTGSPRPHVYGNTLPAASSLTVILQIFGWLHFAFVSLFLLVLGANGRTGLEVVRQALERNYRVTAFVRDDRALVEDALLRKHQNLLIVRGSPTCQNDIDRCVDGQDVIINVIGVSGCYAITNKTKQTNVNTCSFCVY